jgi:hypothetical protein
MLTSTFSSRWNDHRQRIPRVAMGKTPSPIFQFEYSLDANTKLYKGTMGRSDPHWRRSPPPGLFPPRDSLRPRRRRRRAIRKHELCFPRIQEGRVQGPQARQVKGPFLPLCVQSSIRHAFLSRRLVAFFLVRCCQCISYLIIS